MNCRIGHAAIVMAAFLAPGLALGDWVTLSDGRREQCIVLEANENWVRLERQAGVLSLAASQVVRIERQARADNDVLRAEYAFDASSSNPAALQAAIRAFDRAQASGASEETLFGSLLAVLEDALAGPAQLPEGSAAQLADLLERIAEKETATAPPEFLLQSSLFLVRSGRTDEALELFLNAPKAVHETYPEWRGELVRRLADDIQALMQEHRLEDAVQRMAVLGALDPKRGTASRHWSLLTQADLMTQAGRYAGAMENLVAIAGEYPQIARTRALALIRAAVEANRQTGDFRSTLALTTGDARALLGAKPAEQLRAEIYRDWGLWCLDRGDYAGAREALGQFYILSPADSRKLLDLVEYRECAAQLAPGDAEGHYDLGVFCRKAGLPEQARAEFRLALDSENWADLAQRHLEDLESERLQAVLAQALELKDLGRYHEGRDMAAQVLASAKDEEVRALAQRTLDVVVKSMEYEAKRAPLEAEVLWQRAERCLLPSEAQQCLELLNEILRNYAGTPQARRAIEKRKQILRMGLSDTARRADSPRQMARAETAPAAAPPLPENIDFEALQAELRRMQESVNQVVGP